MTLTYAAYAAFCVRSESSPRLARFTTSFSWRAPSARFTALQYDNTGAHASHSPGVQQHRYARFTQPRSATMQACTRKRARVCVVGAAGPEHLRSTTTLTGALSQASKAALRRQQTYRAGPAQMCARKGGADGTEVLRGHLAAGPLRCSAPHSQRALLDASHVLQCKRCLIDHVLVRRCQHLCAKAGGEKGVLKWWAQVASRSRAFVRCGVSLLACDRRGLEGLEGLGGAPGCLACMHTFLHSHIWKGIHTFGRASGCLACMHTFLCLAFAHIFVPSVNTFLCLAFAHIFVPRVNTFLCLAFAHIFVPSVNTFLCLAFAHIFVPSVNTFLCLAFANIFEPSVNTFSWTVQRNHAGAGVRHHMSAQRCQCTPLTARAKCVIYPSVCVCLHPQVISRPQANNPLWGPCAHRQHAILRQRRRRPVFRTATC